MRRAAARAEWYSAMDQPLQVHDIIAVESTLSLLPHATVAT